MITQKEHLAYVHFVRARHPNAGCWTYDTGEWVIFQNNDSGTGELGKSGKSEADAWRSAAESLGWGGFPELVAEADTFFDELELRPPLDPKGEAAETKCPLQLLPIGPQHETAWVFKLGAEKYGLRNWRTNQVCASTYYGAMRRHLDQWFHGVDLDDESKRHHLAHLIASAMIVMDAAQHGTLEDDRP
jgi:Domain of unknown function (DUF5664)